MTDFNKAMGEGFGPGTIGSALNYRLNDKRGGQKIGGLYIDGVVLPGRSVQGTHETSTVQNYDIGERRITKDGRVFRYSLSVGTCYAGRGNKGTGNLTDDGIASTPAATASVGATKITFGTQTFAVDELKGGYIVMHTASDTQQNRLIVGNDVAAGTTVTIEFDEPITTEVGSVWCEVLPNPYRYIKHESSGYSSNLGVPAVYVSASGSYFWLQTWGPCWMNPGPGNMGGSTGERSVLFNPDGSLRRMAQWGVITDYQHAGFLIQENIPGSDGPPFIMLQVSI